MPDASANFCVFPFAENIILAPGQSPTGNHWGHKVKDIMHYIGCCTAVKTRRYVVLPRIFRDFHTE